jgi:two-component system CheB/CheR fusion protein
MSDDGPSQGQVEKLVVIGSSAGGVEALSILVGGLRSDFAAPLVIAQHLDPTRLSHLSAILERRTSLPVVAVQDNASLEKGKIYVVPANRHVTIADSTVHLEGEGDHGDRPRPSIDLLLSTAAASYRENLIAVVLTGSGSDGASGAVEVKDAGGTVIVQNPHTARYPGMPMAIPPTVVDHILDLEEIGSLLNELAAGFPVISHTRGTKNPLQEILDMISRQAKIDFQQYKPSTIMRRVARRMAATRSQTLEEYEGYLQAHPEELRELVKGFLIKVTRFFRDPEAFDYLKEQLLPTLIENGRANGRVLRCWSAGCATGEEPYSLAMLLAESLGPELPDWSIRIFATDLDENAISFARRGLYPENVLRNLPAEYRARYFEHADQGHRISKVPRQLVIFGHQDLSRGVPFPRLDLVICRNLLIYFKPELQQHVLDKFAYSLAPTGGFLFLGQAETARPSQVGFEIVNKKWKMYRCIGAPTNVRAGFSTFNYAASWRTPGQLPGVVGEVETVGQSAPPAEHDIGPLRRFNELVLRSLPVGVVVIDRAYRIVTINSAARRLLGIREIAAEQDFLHSVRGLTYSDVRLAIDTAFREHGTVALPELEVNSTAGLESRFLNLTIAPLDAEAASPDSVVVTVTDGSEQIQTRRRLEAMQSEQKQLVEELSGANKRLGDINKEFQDANEELQAANEELMLTQEELQATNEEIEATNEELQATNEELETNNEELQATNEELETTNEELQARTGELQELTLRLASERQRLFDMVELAPFYILVLRGQSLVVEAFNPKYTEIFEGRALLGETLEHALTKEDVGDLVSQVHEVYKQDEVRTIPRRLTRWPNERGERTDTYFNYTLVPTHDGGGKVDGVVIYAEDVTEQMAREDKERAERLRLLVENVEGVSLGLYDARSTSLLYANKRFLDVASALHTVSREELLGSTWAELMSKLMGKEEVGHFQMVVDGQNQVRLPELRFTMPGDNSETVWDLYLVPVPNEGSHEVQYVVASAAEVTDQVHARDELERLDKVKDVFLSLASHELRTPLVPLTGYAEMLERLAERKEQENAPGWDKRVNQYVGKFRGQLQHLTRLVDDLFDVARMESGKMALDMNKTDLVAVVSRAIEAAKITSPRQKIVCKVPEEDKPLIVVGDEDRLVQVVDNILQNAIKYAPNGKKIDVSLRRDGREQEQAVLDVRDYGPGIAAEELPFIFKRFYQAASEGRPAESGLGLGLFIAKGIIEQHGGTISVKSTVGKGSTFTVRLPLLDGERGNPME